MMKHKIDYNLHELAGVEPKEIRYIKWYTMVYWLRYRATFLPYPIKIAFVDTLFLPIFLVLMPIPIQVSPAIYIPLLWITAFLVSFIVTSFLPRRKRQIKVHWVN